MRPAALCPWRWSGGRGRMLAALPVLVLGYITLWTWATATYRGPVRALLADAEDAHGVTEDIFHPESSNSSLTVKHTCYLKPEPFIGNPKSKPDVFTIGIPTAKRPAGSPAYIKDTVTSVLGTISDPEKDLITLFIYICDFDVDYQREMVKYFEETYPKEMQAGRLLLMIADKDNYPTFEGLERTYGDAEKRVKWRSKQVVDFALMMHYARNLSSFFILLEDDVTADKGWVYKAQEFVSHQRLPWAMIDLEGSGTRGKLFHREHLSRLVEYLCLFYDKMPVDFLTSRFTQLMVRDKVPRKKLFWHKGAISTLEGQIRPISETKKAVSKGIKGQVQRLNPRGGPSLVRRSQVRRQAP